MMELPPSVLKVTRVLEDILATLDQHEKGALSHAGVNASEARILTSVQSARESRLTDLSRELGMSKSTVSCCLDHLEKMGLITRSREFDDRRVYAVKLTDRGRAVTRKLRQEKEGALAEAASELTPYQRKTLASALDALSDSVKFC